MLDASQALRSFRDGNTIVLPGGAPANVILTGVMTGQVTNPYGAPGDTPSDRAPILTTTGAANTVTLANNSLIDGLFVQGASGFAGSLVPGFPASRYPTRCCSVRAAVCVSSMAARQLRRR